MTLTTPAAVFGKRSRNELDGLEGGYTPGQVLILPTMKTVAAQMERILGEANELQRLLDELARDIDAVDQRLAELRNAVRN